METSSYLREQSERCRRLSHDSKDPKMQVSLRKLGDEYAARADEIEHDQIVKGIDPDDAAEALSRSFTPDKSACTGWACDGLPPVTASSSSSASNTTSLSK